MTHSYVLEHGQPPDREKFPDDRSCARFFYLGEILENGCHTGRAIYLMLKDRCNLNPDKTVHIVVGPHDGDGSDDSRKAD